MIKILLAPASMNLGLFKTEGPVLLLAPLLIGAVLLLVISLRWAYRDARNRQKNGLIALLFIVLTGWPASFLWWLWLRPTLKTPAK